MFSIAIHDGHIFKKNNIPWMLQFKIETFFFVLFAE